jgi:NAD-dependent protein deacetylase/lipoamidase
MDDLDSTIETVRGWVGAAGRIVALTGAGISTDSGIPDFRGPKGLWTRNPDAEKMATLSHYMADREVRKASWRMRIEMGIERLEPNAGHRALARLEQRGVLHTLITQNVDGLHQRAGNSPEAIVEIHGTLREVMCMECDERAPVERVLVRVQAGDEDPACRSCGGILKTATISFGQSLVMDDLRRAELAAQSCDLLLAIGTTLAVYPAAGVVPIAKSCGARIVILNAERTEMDHLADALLRGSISQVLPQIVGALD